MQLHFTRTNGPVDETIDHLIRIADGIHRPEYVREMILAALKAGQEDDEQADLKLMNTTLKEMRFTAKVFGPYRNVRKVTVFGSARLPLGSPTMVVPPPVRAMAWWPARRRWTMAMIGTRLPA